jgi:peptide/nickel transport system permease protein
MPFLPVMLWTDRLLWLLIAVVALYAWYCSRRPHLSAPWKRVFQSKAAVVSGVIVVCYVVIGLADALHYRPRLEAAGSASTGPIYSLEVLSVLDLALSHLRARQERTYSAPLATRLYAKEQMQLDGKTVRDFPRLRYGGAHLKDESDLAGDVAARIGRVCCIYCTWREAVAPP